MHRITALSVKQPWASLIAHGIKTVEVRAWHTHYRGPLVICASQAPDKSDAAALALRGRQALYRPLGVVVAVVELVEVCAPWRGAKAAALIDPAGAFCWRLSDAQTTEHLPIKGKLGLFTLPEEVSQVLLSAHGHRLAPSSDLGS